MAAGLPQDLDGFLPLLSTSDIKMKVTVGNKLFTYLEEPTNSIECSDIGMFIDCIVQWLLNNNPKVSQYGIEIITQLINKMKKNFRPYISTILPLTVDRLGDNKETIKVKAFFLIMKLMECNIITPQALFDKISVTAFCHKNSNVKEGSMNLLLSTIEEFGANCITISKIVPMILKLLSDPNVQVRHKAFDTLVGLYKHVGDKLCFDIQKTNVIPQSKITDLMNKFEETRAAGDLLQTAFVGLDLVNDDETDHTCTLAPRCTLNSIKRPDSFCSQNSTTPLQRLGSIRKPISSFSHTGAVDEDTFIRSFENVPTVHILNARNLNDVMKKLHESIQDVNEQWNKRVESLKKIRSLLLIGATKYEEFFNNLRCLEHSFQTSVKDLRSQVVRETCITIAFLSQRLGIKFNHFAEFIFSNLIDLIPNAAKVIASSGLVTLRFILEYTHAPRIIPILANCLGSKSKDIRCACCEFFNQILRTWPTQLLERHITIIQDSIKKGIADADSNARVLSRKAFWAFYEHFSEQGEILLNKLDPIYRKALLTNSKSNLCSSKSVIAEVTKSPSRRLNTPQNNILVRSSSAMDLQTTQRVKARTEYAAFARQKVNIIVSSQSVKKTKEYMYQTDRDGRSRSRVSFSQPTSRSGSPSSKCMFGQPKSPKGYSGIPRSQNISRESSPNRFNFIGLHSCNKPPFISSPESKTIMAHKILMHSQEAESTLAYALIHKSPRKIVKKSINYYSDENDIFSASSEHSINSHWRPSGSFYRNGLQRSLDKDIWMNSVLNIEDIISNCESSNWNNRKEGLVSLQIFLQEGNIINEVLLKRLTNVFTKMFMDSQTKLISLFLDALNELIVTHNQYIEYWLYILLVKLFYKRGSDILGSVHSKILKTMEIVRLSFPSSSQLIAVFKFLVDPTQTPNVKMKIFAMNYIRKLAVNTDSGLAFSSAIDGKKDYATLALTKMIGWTMDNNIKQSAELRRAAQEAIQVLYNLNASQITLRLSQLPKEYQEVVFGLIQMRIRRSSVDELQLITQKYQNKPSPTSSLASPPLQPDFTDNLQSTDISDEISKSLKQTPIDVQKYNSERHYTGEKNIAPHDSGISQMSVRTETFSDNSNDYKNGYTTENGIVKILNDLNKDTLNVNYKQTLLNHLKELIKDGPSNVLVTNFKKIFKVVLKLLFDDEPFIREQAIILITYLVKKPEMIPSFCSYTELIIMKVLDMCCDPCKSVVRVAEKCSLTLSICLQSQTVVRVITPLISVKEFPINLIATKMITILIDKHGSLPVAAQIKELMSSLLQGYENPDSSVRKATVYCLVSLHKVFGEQELLPYLSNLSSAKLKLLNLYIERAQQNNNIIQD